MLTDSGSRTISGVLQDIVQNIEEIFRSEVRLARAELGQELGKTRSAGTLLGAGAICAFFTAFFALFACVLALSKVVPTWSASLIVAAAMAIPAGILFFSGRARLRRVHLIPERTVESVKDNIQWVKQHSK